MDVNRPTMPRSVGEDSKRRSPYNKNKHSQKDQNGQQQDAREQNEAYLHKTGAAVAASGSLMASEMPPELKTVFDFLSNQLDETRRELLRMRNAEERFEEQASAHPILPVVNRREFVRQITHALTHMDEDQSAPSLIVAHVKNGDVTRTHLGRMALDTELREICKYIEPSVGEHGVLGSLCGNDFGIILLSGDLVFAQEKIDEWKGFFLEKPFNWKHRSWKIEIAFGATALKAGDTAEDVILRADVDLLKELQKNSRQ